MPATSRRSALPLPTGRGWVLVAAAFVAGLLAFLVVWVGQRGAGSDDALPAGEAPPAAAAPAPEPLPAPSLPGSPGSVEIREIASTGARLEETPSAARPVPGAASVSAPDTGPEAAGQAPTAATLPAASAPVLERSPHPRYPARAQRRGESGEVVLSIDVDARGRVARASVASSSGSKDLDRAALDAVRRWRFRPAMRDGRPVPATVTVPIAFDASR